MKLLNIEKRNFVKDDYNAIANLYANEDRNINLYSPFIDEFIKNLHGNSVLDAGCGAGEFTNYLKTNNLNVIGVDFSEKLISIAKSRFESINFICSDICDYYTKQKLDGIFSKDTLFHLPDEDLERVIQKFYDILSSNGKLLIILDIPKTAGEEIYDEPLDTNYKLYYNYLTEEKIKNILLNNKFKIDKVEYPKDEKELYVYAQGIMAIYASK